MKYIGKLYGKVGGKTFDTGKTSEDWDAMESQLSAATKENERLIEVTNNHRDTIIQLQLDYGNKCAENKRLREALKGIKNIDDIDDEAWMIAHAALTPNNEQNNIK